MLFQWLMQYHCSENLGLCLPYFKDGRITDARGFPLHEGSDVNTPPYHGVLIVANGDTLAQRLRQDRVIHDEPTLFSPFRTVEDLSLYFPRQEDCDGAYIYDGVHRTIARVGEINNNPPSLPEFFEPYAFIPEDFVSYTSAIANDRIGTKTRLAIKLPHAFPHTETYQVKRSAYGPLGLGKVTHFGKEGLQEEFFLHYDPYSKGPFIAGGQGIVGIYRKYWFDGEKVQKIGEKLIDPFAPLVNYRDHHSSDVRVAHL